MEEFGDFRRFFSATIPGEFLENFAKLFDRIVNQKVAKAKKEILKQYNIIDINLNDTTSEKSTYSDPEEYLEGKKRRKDRKGKNKNIKKKIIENPNKNDATITVIESKPERKHTKPKREKTKPEREMTKPERENTKPEQEQTRPED